MHLKYYQNKVYLSLNVLNGVFLDVLNLREQISRVGTSDY